MLKITDTDTGQIVTCEPEEIREKIAPWFEDAPEDSREEVMQVIQDLQEAWTTGGDSESCEQYLGVKVTYEEEPLLQEWPTRKGYGQLLPREKARLLTRCHIDQALYLSGEMGDTTLVRHAFILRTLGVARLEDAQTSDRKTVTQIFREAHAKAHAEWEDEQEDIYSGERLTGPAIDTVRQIIGASNRELAHDLRVDERTVRAWTKGRDGYSTPPAGVTNEVAVALHIQIGAARALIDAGVERGSHGCPVFTTHDDPTLVLIAATLLAAEGRRFNIDPLLCPHEMDPQFCPRCFLSW